MSKRNEWTWGILEGIGECVLQVKNRDNHRIAVDKITLIRNGPNGQVQLVKPPNHVQGHININPKALLAWGEPKTRLSDAATELWSKIATPTPGQIHQLGNKNGGGRLP